MGTAELDSNVDPRVVRTRKLISQALTELLEEKSLPEITVQEIASRATINRSTFYSHYQDKFDLFSTLMRERFRNQVLKHVPRESGVTPDKIRGLILALCEIQESLLDHRTPGDQQVHRMFAMELQALIKEELLNWQGVEPSSGEASMHRLHASLVSWGIFGAVSDWARRPERDPAGDFAARLGSLLESQRMNS